MRQNSEIILHCLNLVDALGVRLHFYDALGRAIVTVDTPCHEVSSKDIRLASKTSGWDVEVFAVDGFEEMKQDAFTKFVSIDGISAGLAKALIRSGYFAYDDLELIAPNTLMELGAVDSDCAESIIEQAESMAE